MASKKLILAIETSCDETAASILEIDLKTKKPNFKIRSSVVLSQISAHSKFGGVVPELAARMHAEAITPVVKESLKKAKAKLSDLDFIAVTQGPGLISALLVGVEYSKALSLANQTPLIPINHLLGHLYSPYEITKTADIEYPLISVIVSGGHTLLVHQKNEAHHKVIGTTLDDAAGEAFDKVAKLLNLPYPGGPQISKLADKGQSSIQFPRPMINSGDFNFSFAGLKTAVRYFLEDPNNHNPKSDIARSFQDAVVEVLSTKTLQAAQKHKAKAISLSGGVAANKELRSRLQTICDRNDLKLYVPSPELCTDNASMIGIAAYFSLRSKNTFPNPLKIQANPSLQLK